MAKKENPRKEKSGLRALVFTEGPTTIVVTDDRVVRISNGLAYQESINSYDSGVRKLLEHISEKLGYLKGKDSKPEGYECRIRTL